jgi:hypothetical protein
MRERSPQDLAPRRRNTCQGHRFPVEHPLGDTRLSVPALGN